MMHESFIYPHESDTPFYRLSRPIPPYTSIYSVEGGTYKNKGILFSIFLFYETSDFWDL